MNPRAPRGGTTPHNPRQLHSVTCGGTTPHTPRQLHVSVAICAFTDKRWDDVHTAVESVRVQRHAPYEIILSVDHNPDLYARLKASMPDVVVVQNRHARGLSGGKNTGAVLAGGDVVAYLDDDAVAAPGWLETLAEGYADPAVIGVGGRTLPLWPGSPSARDLLADYAALVAELAESPAEAGTRPRWFPEEFDWAVGCTYRGMAPGPIRNLMGGNCSFRVEAFELAGGFTTGIGRSFGKRPLGCEETEFCIRLGQRAPESVMIFDDRAVIWHRVPVERARFGYLRTRCYAEGLSKALVTRSVGSGDGLASERTHVLKALPRGVARGLRDTFRGDVGGLGRASAIVTGLFYTVWGYTVGTLAARHRSALGVAVPAEGGANS